MGRPKSTHNLTHLWKAYESHMLAVPEGQLRRTSVGYRLMPPAEIVRGERYALVVFLHGAGERGFCNSKQLKYLPEQLAQPAWRKKYPAYVLAPQCPANKKWVAAPWSSKIAAPLAAEPALALELAVRALEETLERHPIDGRRVYLTGLSMGGFGAWELAMRRPGLFAALAPICGGGDETQAARLAALPVWAWHGGSDDMVPVVRSRNMVAAMRAAGGKPKYTELPGVGHHSWVPAYAEKSGLLKWMFRQIRKP